MGCTVCMGVFIIVIGNWIWGLEIEKLCLLLVLRVAVCPVRCPDFLFSIDGPFFETLTESKGRLAVCIGHISG